MIDHIIKFIHPNFMHIFFQGVTYGGPLSLFHNRFAEPVAINYNEAARQLQTAADTLSTTEQRSSQDELESDPIAAPKFTNPITAIDDLLSQIFGSWVEPADKTAVPNFQVASVHDKATSLIYSFGLICHIECSGLDCVQKCKECDKAACKETIQPVTLQQPEPTTNKQPAAVTEPKEAIVDSITVDEAVDEIKSDEETVLEKNTNEETAILTDVDALDVDEKDDSLSDSDLILEVKSEVILEDVEEKSTPKLSLFSHARINDKKLKVIDFLVAKLLYNLKCPSVCLKVFGET